ncbi:methyltransferase-like protein 27 isoform X2 [Scyliorhinus canicula]|uniref:methyltransferase-like protein 27 isoform X2 n=1 Tax=Scyliorhinus canicula TaxID=7830 RepID=UPI0018F50FC7|nr:methyltransferase-like protein 27 isoform X2 [Scyliorhinus canicula]
MEAEKEVNYDTCAENYEMCMSVMDYQAPRFSVETVDSVYLGDREDALVLDVPCGTGLVADGLQKLGFKNFHGIDGSEGMLKIAESKGLYQRLTHWILTSDKPLPIEPESEVARHLCLILHLLGMKSVVANTTRRSRTSGSCVHVE